MVRREEVEAFLKDFIYKLNFWGLLIRTNPKIRDESQKYDHLTRSGI